MFVAAVKVPRWVAGLLAFVAGVVDACTVFALFGLFVAQVTGSFVLIGAQIVNADIVNVIRTLAIPLFFLAGFAAVLLAELADNSRKALIVTVGVELLLVGALAVIGLSAAPFAHPNAPLALVAGVLGVTAMGVQSALVRLLMRGVASTNVMTTNTTLAAIELAQWLVAARRLAKHPDDAAAKTARRRARDAFANLWPVLAGFLAGACCGAIGYTQVGFSIMLLAVALLAALLLWAIRLR